MRGSFALRRGLQRAEAGDGAVTDRMRVLVTGSHGYIGSVLAPELQTAGYDVTGLDTCFYDGCDFGADLASIPTVRRDVRDVTPSDFDGFDAVVHLAALSNDPIGDLNEQWTYDINLDATLRVARAAKDAGVRRFVFASSCSMYGASGTDDLLDEDAPLRPLTAYAESKVRAEEGLAGLVDDDFVVVSMRNATVYGVSPRLRLDIVLNNLAGWAQTTGRIRLLSDGMSWRPLIHVRDLSRVAVAILAAPEELVRGQAFNVGSAEQNYLVRDLAGVLAEVTGCSIELASAACVEQLVCIEARAESVKGLSPDVVACVVKRVSLAHFGMQAADAKRRAKQQGAGSILIESV